MSLTTRALLDDVSEALIYINSARGGLGSGIYGAWTWSR